MQAIGELRLMVCYIYASTKVAFHTHNLLLRMHSEYILHIVSSSCVFHAQMLLIRNDTRAVAPILSNSRKFHMNFQP